MTHGKSVVVPVEPTQEMIDAGWNDVIQTPETIYRAMVTYAPAAPAPSSLAGGEVLEALARIIDPWAFEFEPWNENWTSVCAQRKADAITKADTILAALSPEAPAREGVVKACADFQEAIDYFEADVADALADDSERADLWDREITVNIDALKTVMSAALTPRHEAPASEGDVS